MEPSFGRVAVIGKHGTEVAGSVRETLSLLQERGCKVLLERETAAALGEEGHAFDAIGRGADLAVVIGGDGTMLAAARSLVQSRVPLIGVNQGRVGFMTDIGHDDMRAGLAAVLDGRYTLEERALIDAEVRRGEATLLQTIALNEAVLGKGDQGRLIEFELFIDGEFVYKLRGDGMIVATPTGSTAYSLSAQGPILHPAVRALALVPLNPHTLSARPVSVNDASVIEIRVVGALDARAHFDGVALADLAEGDRMVLRRSAFTARFVHPPGYRYFATLREKLGWSEALDRSRLDRLRRHD